MAGSRKKLVKFTASEVSVFCEQIAMLLNSGIPIHEGIYMLYHEMEDKRTRQILEQLESYVKMNQPFYEALGHTNSFPDYMIHMVRVGETTGKLEEVMRSLAVYYERENNVKVSIKSAIAYPCTLLAIMSVIILILAFKILPMFESMFHELSAEVAVPTQTMMTTGMIAGKVLAVIILTFLVAVLAILIWSKTKKGEYILYRFILNFGVTKKLSEAIAVSKFISSMALMISSGIEMNKAMEIAYGSSNHRRVKDKIKQCRILLDKNVPLDEAIHDTKLLVGMESSLVTIAAKTGSSDIVFEKLSEQYSLKVSDMLNKLSTTIETILVVSLAVLVGGVLISVMLPLISMISSIG